MEVTQELSSYLGVDRFTFECHLMVLYLDVILQNKPGCSKIHDPVNPLLCVHKLDVFRHLATNTGHEPAPPLLQPSTELISPPIRAAFVD